MDIVYVYFQIAKQLLWHTNLISVSYGYSLCIFSNS